MSKATTKLKILQQELGISPGEDKPRKSQEAAEGPTCPDVVPWSARCDTPASARYRAAQDSVRVVRHGEESQYFFGEAGIEQVAHDLMQARGGEVRLTIDIHVNETEEA